MPTSVLIADDEPTLVQMLAETLADEGYEVQTVLDGEAAVQKLHERPWDIVLTDLRMPKRDGMEVLREAKRTCATTAVVVMTAYGTVPNAVEAMQLGATDYLLKPPNFDELLLKLDQLRHLRDLENENQALRDQMVSRVGSQQMRGQSSALQRVQQLIHQVAPVDSTVLITGESGTGKELVARAIHAASPRAGKLFLAFNCCCGPSELVDASLFGYVKGAYTGATDSKPGLFRAAEGGTLFLDEVGSLPPQSQGKLLRALDHREIHPVGCELPITVDTRILAATNSDLAELVALGKFREDLYFRLKVFPIQVPPLRARRTDIPLLAEGFLEEFATQQGRQIHGFEPQTMDCLQRYRWPGNIRELRNTIEHAVLVCQEREYIGVQDLPTGIAYPSPADERPAGYLKGALRDYERNLIAKALRENANEKALTAQSLGISLSSLYRKLEQLEEYQALLSLGVPSHQ